MTQKASGMPTIQRLEPTQQQIDSAITRVQQNVIEGGVSAQPLADSALKDAVEVLGSTIELKSTEIMVVAVKVPYVNFENPKDSYLNETRRCDLGALSQEHARKLRAIRRGYDLSGVRTASGHEVDSLANAVKALLDSIEI